MTYFAHWVFGTTNFIKTDIETFFSRPTESETFLTQRLRFDDTEILKTKTETRKVNGKVSIPHSAFAATSLCKCEVHSLLLKYETAIES